MQTAQPHLRSLQFAFVNLHGPYLYSVFFASYTCFNQSEHLCRLISKRAGRQNLLYILSCVEFSMFRLSLSKRNRDRYVCTVWSKSVLVRNTCIFVWEPMVNTAHGYVILGGSSWLLT